MAPTSASQAGLRKRSPRLLNFFEIRLLQAMLATAFDKSNEITLHRFKFKRQGQRSKNSIGLAWLLEKQWAKGTFSPQSSARYKKLLQHTSRLKRSQGTNRTTSHTSTLAQRRNVRAYAFRIRRKVWTTNDRAHRNSFDNRTRIEHHVDILAKEAIDFWNSHWIPGVVKVPKLPVRAPSRTSIMPSTHSTPKTKNHTEQPERTHTGQTNFLVDTERKATQLRAFTLRARHLHSKNPSNAGQFRLHNMLPNARAPFTDHSRIRNTPTARQVSV
jgi:hypothetical protein